MISRVMDKKGITVRDRSVLYKAVVYTVLLYWSDSWVITGEIIKVLEDFRHHIACRFMGKTACIVGKDCW